MRETRVKALRHYRIMAELTQEELAEELDVSTSTVNRWENGERSPHLKMLSKIAEVLKCEVSSLVSDPPQPSDRKRIRRLSGTRATKKKRAAETDESEKLTA